MTDRSERLGGVEAGSLFVRVRNVALNLTILPPSSETRARHWPQLPGDLSYP